MTLIACLDDRSGLLFNGRRQSRDRLLLDDLLRSLPGRLLIRPFSADLFSPDPRIVLCGDPLALAVDDDTVFLEDQAPVNAGRFQRIVLYRWNRVYPSDLRFTLSPAEEGFALTQSLDFAGSSHEKITKEVWEREK